MVSAEVLGWTIDRAEVEGLSEEVTEPLRCEGSAVCECVCRRMDILGSSNRLCRGPEAEKALTSDSGLSHAAYPIRHSRAAGVARTCVRKNHCGRLSSGPQRHQALFPGTCGC